ILRQPQDHRFVGNGVGGVDQEFDQKREQELPSRAFEHGELRDEPAEPARSDMLLRGDYLFWCCWHRFSDDSRFLRERMRVGGLIKRALYADARSIEHV